MSPQTNEEKEARIKDIINDELRNYFPEETPNYFTFTPEVDGEYRLKESTINEILYAKNPKDAFIDAVNDDLFQDVILQDAYNAPELWDTLENNAELQQLLGEIGANLEDYLIDMVHITLPYDHYLNQTILLDIKIDTGDADREFTSNNFADPYYGQSKPDRTSSLAWLCEAQGISREKLTACVLEGAQIYSEDQIQNLTEKKALEDTLKEVLHGEDSATIHGRFIGYRRMEKEYNKIEAKIRDIDAKIAIRKEPYEKCVEEMKKRGIKPGGVFYISEEDYLEVQKNSLANLADLKNEYEENRATYDQNPEFVKFHETYQTYKQFMETEFKPMSKTMEYKKNRFLETIIEESENQSSAIGVLTFCVQASLEEAMKLTKALQEEETLNQSYNPDERTGTGYLVLDQNSTCGLYDPANGGGSIFGIEMAEDVTIPLKYIASISADDPDRSFCIQRVYGVDEEFYTKDAVKDIVAMSQLKEKTKPIESLIADAKCRKTEPATKTEAIKKNEPTL